MTEGVHLTIRWSLCAVANDEGPELHDCRARGWQGGQLESEIARNVWLTVEANPSVLFDQPFERRLDVPLVCWALTSLVSPEAGHS